MSFEDLEVVEHEHDPRNHRESLRDLLGKISDSLDECPDCGAEVTGVRGSVGMVLAEDSRVIVHHKTGVHCEGVSVPVDWHSKQYDDGGMFR